MQENSISGLAVVPGPNMSYLTGSKFHLSERPVVLIIEQNKSTFILPELESAKVSGLDADCITYDEKMVQAKLLPNSQRITILQN